MPPWPVGLRQVWCLCVIVGLEEEGVPRTHSCLARKPQQVDRPADWGMLPVLEEWGWAWARGIGLGQRGLAVLTKLQVLVLEPVQVLVLVWMASG